MREVPNWDVWALNIADSVSKRSKDPRTQVGCVILNKWHEPVSFGYNGFKEGAEETPELWERANKKAHVIHAEINALRFTSWESSCADYTIYIPIYPCMNCATEIVERGIGNVVVGGTYYQDDKVEEFFAKHGTSFKVITGWKYE